MAVDLGLVVLERGCDRFFFFIASLVSSHASRSVMPPAVWSRLRSTGSMPPIISPINCSASCRAFCKVIWPTRPSVTRRDLPLIRRSRTKVF